MTDSKRRIEFKDENESDDSDIIFLDDNDNEIISKNIVFDSDDDVPLADLATNIKVSLFLEVLLVIKICFV
jgi:hypothetical protein